MFIGYVYHELVTFLLNVYNRVLGMLTQPSNLNMEIKKVKDTEISLEMV